MEHKNTHAATLTQYIFGFVLSIALTLGSYFLVQNKILTGDPLITAIFVFAFIQLAIQLLFFLHLANEENPRWNLIVFISTFGVILLVVVASIWIMTHLNYNMTPMQINKHILQEEGMPNEQPKLNY